MLGLIKKDFLLIKSNLKSITLILILYIIMSIQGSLVLTYIIPFLGIMILTSTFSYDDFNHWHTFAISLPQGRNNIVKAKYITGIIMIIILSIFSLAISYFLPLLSNKVIPTNILTDTFESAIAIIIIISFMFPIIIKYGSTNGRIKMLTIFFIISIAIGIGYKFITPLNHIPSLKNINNYLDIIIPIVSIIFLYLSYKISCKIYQKKEF